MNWPQVGLVEGTRDGDVEGFGGVWFLTKGWIDRWMKMGRMLEDGKDE